MKNKKISWITPLCYVDVDLPIIKELQNVYDIYWFVILNSKDGENRRNTWREQKRAYFIYVADSSDTFS